MTALRALLAGVVCAGGVALAPAAQAGEDGFTVERRLLPGAPGPNRVALDEELLVRAKPVRYADTAAAARPGRRPGRPAPFRRRRAGGAVPSLAAAGRQGTVARRRCAGNLAHQEREWLRSRSGSGRKRRSTDARRAAITAPQALQTGGQRRPPALGCADLRGHGLRPAGRGAASDGCGVFCRSLPLSALDLERRHERPGTAADFGPGPSARTLRAAAGDNCPARRRAPSERAAHQPLPPSTSRS